jgi:molybdopterin molybdotransferase
VSSALPWDQARRVAAAAARALDPVAVRLEAALGCALAAPIAALTDLPPFDAAAMDGYAVAGPSPWLLADADVRAGSESLTRLDPGTAVAIATGAALPEGCDAVLRSEQAGIETALHGNRLFPLDPLTGLPDDSGASLPPGTDVRPRGEECAAGEPLVPAGSVVTPAMLGLAAAAGYDSLEVIPPPTVAILVLGDELLERGLPRPGRVRDALGPLVPPWLADLGARANPPIRVPDTRQALLEEIEDSTADAIVTTGSTAAGPVDFVHDVLDHLGARWVVDGVQVRPGHPMLLAVLPDGRPIVGLPGNPLAAVSGLVTLAAPVISAMRGVPLEEREAVLGVDVTSHPRDTRIIPVVVEDGQARPLRFDGPAMLRSLALADALVAIPPSGGLAGSAVTLLPVPVVR